jgi:hypothetical protein
MFKIFWSNFKNYFRLDEDDENEEEIYRRAQFIAEDGGLDVILKQISTVKSLTSKSRPLLDASLKLLSFCVKLKSCREMLATESSGIDKKHLKYLIIRF